MTAIGEGGLDFHRIENQASEKSKVESLKEKQKEVFIKHLKLAKEVNKPIIIHRRDAHNDLLKFALGSPASKRGDALFYRRIGTSEKYIDLGFYISFSGVITFPPRKGETAGAYDKNYKKYSVGKNSCKKPTVRMPRPFRIGEEMSHNM